MSQHRPQDEMLTSAMAELAGQGCWFALTVVSVCGDWRGLGLVNFFVPAIINLSSLSLALALLPGSAAVPAFVMELNRETRICVQMDEQDAETELGNPAEDKDRT